MNNWPLSGSTLYALSLWSSPIPVGPAASLWSIGSTFGQCAASLVPPHRSPVIVICEGMQAVVIARDPRRFGKVRHAGEKRFSPDCGCDCEIWRGLALPPAVGLPCSAPQVNMVTPLRIVNQEELQAPSITVGREAAEYFQHACRQRGRVPQRCLSKAK